MSWGQGDFKSGEENKKEIREGIKKVLKKIDDALRDNEIKDDKRK
ncbi:hypothetical protein [Risungbinella massiliensis]|nr:hypothetical protein [Risungbinella massiliensis]